MVKQEMGVIFMGNPGCHLYGESWVTLGNCERKTELTDPIYSYCQNKSDLIGELKTIPIGFMLRTSQTCGPKFGWAPEDVPGPTPKDRNGVNNSDNCLFDS